MQWVMIVTILVGMGFIILCGRELAMQKPRIKFPEIKRWHVVAGLSVIVIGAVFLRFYYSFPNVFQEGSIFFLESDSYYHMGAVDNILKNIGSVPLFTIITEELQMHRLMSLIIASLSWIVGLGKPTASTINTVGALLPPIAGGLVIISTYFLASRLFNRYIAVVSCLFLAVIPSEFLHRSLLGFTDQHIFEVLFTVLIVLCLVLAAKAVGKRQITYYALAGVGIFLYIANWEGGLYMVFFGMLYWLTRTIIMIARKEDYLMFSVHISIMLGVATVLCFPFNPRLILGAYMGVAAALPSVLTLIYYFYHHRKPIPATALLIAVILPLFMVSSAGMYLFFATRMGWVSQQVWKLYDPSLIIWPWLMIYNFFRPDMIISEAQPLIFPSGVFSLDTVWANFQWLFFIQFSAIGYIIARWRKNLDYSKVAFIVWSILMLILAMFVRRYTYYLTISVAILGAVFLYQVFSRISLKRVTAYGGYAVVICLIVGLMITPAIRVAAMNQNQINADWKESLAFLEDQPIVGNVTAWGDYGHWIKRIADKPVNYTPGGYGSDVAQLFVYAGTEPSRMFKDLKSDYFITDKDTVNGKFHAVIKTAGLDKADFYDTFYYFTEYDHGRPELHKLTLFLPRYYESLGVRLFYFNRGDYVPPDVPVYYYQVVDIDGEDQKLIQEVKRYGDIWEAMDAIGASEYEGVVASEYPSYSPVPLMIPEGLEVIYNTESVKIAKVSLTN